jgi:exonuclease I
LKGEILWLKRLRIQLIYLKQFTPAKVEKENRIYICRHLITVPASLNQLIRRNNMKRYTIEFDEQVTVWQTIRTTVEVEDDVVITKENAQQFIENNCVDTERVETYLETEDRVAYDFDRMEVFNEN